MKQLLCILLVLSLIVPVVGADERPMTKAEAVAVSSLQVKIDRAGADWVAGQTTMSHLSKVERQRLGKARIRKDPSVVPLQAGYKVPYGTFDWRNKDGKNWITPVKSQGSCGSCWAFGAVGAVEAKINIDNRNPNIDADLSEQHLVSQCCSNCGDCNGGYPTSALSYIQNTGIPNETCFKYTARNGACSPCEDWTGHVYQLERYDAVASNTDAFKWALRENGPMVVVLRVPDDWYYYRSGVYEPVNKVGWANHCVVLVGYSDPGGYWIIKNSWGSGWGEDGYARVKYGKLEQYNYGYSIINTSTPAPPEPVAHWYTLTISWGGIELPLTLPLTGIEIKRTTGEEVLRWSAS